MAETFRLASVLRLRERERDQAAQDLDQVHRAIAILDERTSLIQNEYQEHEAIRQQSLCGQVPIQRLLDTQRYQIVLTGQLQHIAQQREQLVLEKNRRESVLIARQQKVKALEKLREKHQEEERNLQQIRQQSRIDEWSVNREARSKS